MTIDRCTQAASLRKPILGVLALLLLSSNAIADTGSLLGAGGYPASSCKKPLKPFTPVQLESSNEALMYKMTVDRYNKDAQAYTDCVNAYLATATADVALIQAQMDAAVAAANAP